MQTFEDLLKSKLLASPQALPVYDKIYDQRFVKFNSYPDSMLSCCISEYWMDIAALRDKYSGEIYDFSEVGRKARGMTARNSLALSRTIVSSNMAKGNPENLPFWPGGFDLPCPLHNEATSTVVNIKSYLTVPPGFQNGLDFASNSSMKGSCKPALSYVEVLVKSDILAFNEDINCRTTSEDFGEVLEDHSPEIFNQAEHTTLSLDLTSSSDTKSPGMSVQPKKYEWAVHVNLDGAKELFKSRVSQPAKTWPFELDPFQKQAIIHIEAQENVFVAAHTSAGKTVVAEYAIALALKHHTKVIYTSPLKALSNQKFRDFRETFSHEIVGLLTGDVQVEVSAPCLIMTTEILRSMLYNGSDIIRDVEWVVFDEVHYVNDLERGVVWEETLIMLPDHVGVILLSATVPNAMEFADWIGCTKRKNIYVVSTTKRPVPLEHYVYTGSSPKTADQLFKIVDQESKFVTTGYQEALQAKKQHLSKKVTVSKSLNHERNIWMSLITMLQKKDKLPVVSFTFSRKRCDNNASSLTTLDLTTSTEKNVIRSFFMKCISRLKGSDQMLPQVMNMKDLLTRGIGVHHSGVLPLLKEIIELLFQKGLVRLLFATETFAMGVNMPARSVVFDSTQKHDGHHKRELLSGEYIQMAGRAGRRGLDSTGTVIIMCKDYNIPESSDLHRMILGKPVQLESKFRVTYSMILSLAKVDTLRIEDMLKKSYIESNSTRELPAKEKQLKAIATELEVLREKTTYPEEIDHIYEICERLKSVNAEIWHGIGQQSQLRKVVSPGRLALVATSEGIWEVIVLLSVDSQNRKFTAMLPCEKGEEKLDVKGYQSLQAPGVSSVHIWTGPVTITVPLELSYTIADVPEDCLMGIINKTLVLEPNKIFDDFKNRQIPRFRNNPPSQHAQKVLHHLHSFLKEEGPCPPLLDPLKDLRINTFEVVQKIKEADRLREKLKGAAPSKNPLFMKQFECAGKKANLYRKASELKFSLSEDSLCLLPEYKSREKVLKRLGYLDEHGVVKHKGKVASNLNTHEVFLTELLHENLFRDFTLEEKIALLSPLVFQQSRCSEPNLTQNLSIGRHKMEEVAKRLAMIEVECGVDTSVEDYLSEFNWGLIEVVYQWALGMPFSDIAQLTDVHEGIIVRCIQRLDELFKSIKTAARVIGNSELQLSMAQASETIRRDIIFAASLYIQ